MFGINSDFGRSRAIICGIFLAALPALHGQQSSSAPVEETEATGWRRLSFGGRVNGYPFNVMHNKDVSVTPANTTATWAISTTNDYTKISFGPTLEFRVWGKFAVCGELLYHRLNYTQTSQITDTVVGNTGITETTRATLWDLPVMLRYRGLRESGLLSKIYLAGGGEIRRATHIGTSTVTNLPNGTTTTSNAPTIPSKRDVAGAVVGVGLRLVDDFNIKLSPELRYTRWLGATFDSESTRSGRNQLEIGIALTF